MRLIVTGKGMEISKYLEGLVEKKASKLERYFRPETDVYVTLSIEKSRHIAEVTVPFDGVVLRTEEVSGDMYGSRDRFAGIGLSSKRDCMTELLLRSLSMRWRIWKKMTLSSSEEKPSP